MSPTVLRDHPAAAPRPGLPDATPGQLAAWQRRLELEDQVRAAAATMVESRMPAPPVADDRGALVRAGLLVAAAVTVVVLYVGLPLALATRSLLGALPQALLLAASVVVLGTVAVLGVLHRTSLVLRRARHGRAARRR